jgi:hypothetical protein
MHVANASMLDRWLADGWGGGPLGAPTAVWPLPSEEPQAQIATAQPAVDSAAASRTAVALRL